MGVLTNAALLSIGLPPAQASALVHTAEVFTTGASAASHIYHRNVDWTLVRRLGIAGVSARSSARGCFRISMSVRRGRYVYLYLLLMGCYILYKSYAASRRGVGAPAGWTVPLGGLARISRRQRRRRLGTGGDFDAGRARATRRVRP